MWPARDGCTSHQFFKLTLKYCLRLHNEKSDPPKDAYLTCCRIERSQETEFFPGCSMHDICPWIHYQIYIFSKFYCFQIICRIQHIVSQWKSCKICCLGQVVASQGSLTPNEQYKAFQPSSNGRKVSGYRKWCCCEANFFWHTNPAFPLVTITQKM